MPEIVPAMPPVSAKPPDDTLAAKFMAAVITAIVVGGIYLGRPVLMPLALSVLLAFALAPLVAGLRHLRLPQVAAVLIALAMTILLIGSIATFVGEQLGQLAGDLPHYQSNLGAKIESVRSSTAGNDTLNRLVETAEKLGDQILGHPPGQHTTLSQDAERPVPVIIRSSGSAPLEMLGSIAGPLLEPLSIMVVVIVFVGFILLQKDDLRDRFVRLAGSQDLQRTTVALDEAASRLSRYLLLQTIINASFGTLIGIGLWMIGIPNPGLWGLMATLFRFVPYVGVPTAALIPLALAIAVDPGWTKLVWTLVMYVGIEMVTGQAIEPTVYGRSMGMSAVAVVVAAVFWTWLWGPVGLLLSTPLTMCFVVLGRHIDGLKFLDVMLGDQPPLAIEESLYLRLLAGDPDEASDEAEDFLEENSLVEYYDEVGARALLLAQVDVNRGVLDLHRQILVRNSIKGLIHNLSDQKAELAAAIGELPEHWRNTPVLCVAGRGPLDEAVALLLVDVLSKQGIGARVISSDETSATHIDDLATEGVQIACISYLDPGTYKNARYQVRRLRKRMPGVPVMAVFWAMGGDDSRYLDTVEATECDFVATGLRETIDHIVALGHGAAPVRKFQAHRQKV